MKRLVLGAFCLSFFCFYARGEDLGSLPREDPPWQLIFQLDNDLFTGTDHDYTNGIRLALSREFSSQGKIHEGLREFMMGLSGADEESILSDGRFADRESLRFAMGIGLTQLMFTPDDYLEEAAPRGQRPYSGWLGLEFSFHVKDDDSVSSVTLSLGITGESAYAQEAQEWVHKNISDSPIFQGWESQTPQELTVNINFDRKQKVGFLDSDFQGFGTDGYCEWGAALGNFRTNAYVGALLRAGYNLPATYSTPRVQLGSYGHELFRPENPDEPVFSILTFAGVRGSAVLHDITLDGPVFRDYDGAVDPIPFVGELVFGLGFRLYCLEVAFSRTIRSDEFEHQNENQEFGSVMFRCQWRF